MGKEKRILGMLFAMVTQLLLINLSPMKRALGSDTPQRPRGSRYLRLPPGGFPPPPNPIMCLDGPQRGGPPPCLGHLGCLALPPQKQLPGVMGSRPVGAAMLPLGAACISRRKEVFFLHFQDKVSFMRAAC